MSALDRLLAGNFSDPDGGPPLSVPTRSVVIANSLAGAEDSLVKDLGLGGTLAVVSDEITRQVLGARVEHALAGAARVQPIVLRGRPHADMSTVEMLRAESAGADALIAVASGTINDLCKCASALEDKPYAVFGTAPSMNGYTSVNAAITVDGVKKSLPARAPVGVFLDLEVLAAAPLRLIRSGLGDSLCRPTAQADWLLAHLLFDQPYRQAPFDLLAEDEDALFAESGALVAGDFAAMARLARTLVLSGFGMTICGGSYPASQGEHLISHYVEMVAPRSPESLHGEQIGVTTLTMARLQTALVEGGPPHLAASVFTADDLAVHFGPAVGRACWAEFEKKRLDAGAARKLNERLDAEWDRIAEQLSKVMRPETELRAVLDRAGAPTRPEHLGWSADFYRDAVRYARAIRDRYTALDLAGDSGLLERFAATLASGAPGG